MVEKTSDKIILHDKNFIAQINLPDEIFQLNERGYLASEKKVMIHCEFENGDQASLRHVTVGAIAVNDQSEVLLVKRAAHISRPGKYTVPGGFVDRDETISQAALRELTEETGYTGHIQTLFLINDYPNRPNEDRQNIDFLYIVKVDKKISEADSESTEVTWFSIKNLPDEKDFAFDHRAAILKYFDFLKQPFDLPIFGRIQ